jgi:hypothetical protein
MGREGKFKKKVTGKQIVNNCVDIFTIMCVQGQTGDATKYITRSRALTRLQLSLQAFRYANSKANLDDVW